MATLTSTASVQSRHSLLRNTLRANAVFSGISGAVFLLAAQPVTQLLGLAPGAEGVIALLGLVILGCVVLFIMNTIKPEVDWRFGLAALIIDALWVAGSMAILAFDLFGLSTAGRWAVLIVADIVLVFAILEYIGLRRLRA